MNLHGIAAGVVGAVNPQIPLCILVSNGYTEVAGGERVPQYCSPVNVVGQVQPLQYSDIMQMDALNIQGTRRSIYINGRVDGLIRVSNKGGDLIKIDAGVNRGTWLVALIAEQWPDWCRALVTLQDGS